jgi:DNA-binding response OmpR family regulator
LELFLRNGRRILSRSIIIEHIWSLENPPEEDTVKAHIKSLRHKLRAVGAPDDLVETVHGVGYRLKQLS